MRILNSIPWVHNRRHVFAVFVVLPTQWPEVVTGNDEPLIGVMPTEESARRVEESCPGLHISREQVPLQGRKSSLNRSVLLAMEGVADDVIDDRNPSPLQAFTSMDQARAWEAKSNRSDADTQIWEVPYDKVCTSAPSWPRRRLADIT